MLLQETHFNENYAEKESYIYKFLLVSVRKSSEHKFTFRLARYYDTACS
jgi:hypothetical protein